MINQTNVSQESCNMKKWIKGVWIAMLTTSLACGPGEEDNAKDQDTHGTTALDMGTTTTDMNVSQDQNTMPPVMRMGVRDRCVVEIERLFACGELGQQDAMATVAECRSQSFSENQISIFVACVSSWTCGGGQPACLAGGEPAEMCTTDDCGA